MRLRARKPLIRSKSHEQDRLFGPSEKFARAKTDYSQFGTVVFSHAPIGTVGLTEEEAIKRFGAINIKCYNSSFVNLWHGTWYGGAGEKPLSRYKLVCLLPDDNILGVHIIGQGRK